MLARLLRSRTTLPLSGVGANETNGISIYDWAKMFRPGAQVTYGGTRYQAYKPDSAGTSPGADFYDSNPVVFACLAARVLLFAEARFQFQRMRAGRPGDYFGTPDLQRLEVPWPGHSTRDFLAQVEMDV